MLQCSTRLTRWRRGVLGGLGRHTRAFLAYVEDGDWPSGGGIGDNGWLRSSGSRTAGLLPLRQPAGRYGGERGEAALKPGGNAGMTAPGARGGEASS
jgi:hypothetical protein